MAKMSVDDKLGVVKFVTDEHESHIEINEDYQDEAEIKARAASFPAARASRAGIIRRALWA